MFNDVVQQLYICYYGRPADLGGLDYWSKQLVNNKNDLASITNAFGKSPEALVLFQNAHSVSDQIDLIYKNLLNRVADVNGKNSILSKSNLERLP